MNIGLTVLWKKSVACIWDIESHPGGDKRVIDFSKNCDIMIHDTQYTEEEYNSNKIIVQGFGHSTYKMAIENAKQANVKNLICTHFAPSHSDEKLKEIQKSLAKLDFEFNIFLAFEGMSYEL